MLEWAEIYKAREIYKQERIKKMLKEIEEERIRKEQEKILLQKEEGIPFDASKRHLCNVAERFKRYAQKTKDPEKKKNI